MIKRELLRKYMRFIKSEEGITYLAYADPANWESEIRLIPAPFTPSEYALLKEIEGEL